MKTQAKDAVALAMDWLAQLRDEDGRDEDGAGWAPGADKPAIDSAPPAGELEGAAPARPPAAEWEGAAPATPPAAEWEGAAPATPPTPEWGSATWTAPPAAEWADARPAGPPEVEWGSAAPAAPPAFNWRDARPATPAADWESAAPVEPPAADWRDARPATPAADWESAAPVEPPAADWRDAAPAAPAADFWSAAAPSADYPGPAAAPSADHSGPAAAVSPGTTTPGRAGTKAPIEITERAAIGDELRIPLAWCEMGSCISYHADPAALGEADIRARAIAAGWRVDALGRLACPQCQQADSWFWTAHPVALWDRDTAVAMTTLMAAAVREITGADGGAGMAAAAPPGGEPGATPGGELDAVPGPRPEMARPPGRGRHRGHPAHSDRAQ
jgi:hypothetical protein